LNRDLKKWFPLSEKELEDKKFFYEASLKCNPDAVTVRSNLDAILFRFKGTNLCEQLKEKASKSFEYANCTKIVAFGGSTMCPPSKFKSAISIHWLTQHTSLLVLREIWETTPKNKGQTLPIYLQDPQYLPLDVEVAREYKLEVVSCAMEH
jgi:hypothetical protein